MGSQKVILTGGSGYLGRGGIGLGLEGKAELQLIQENKDHYKNTSTGGALRM